MFRRSGSVTGAMLLLGLAACGGGGGGTHTVPQATQALPATPLGPSSFTYGAALLRGASNPVAVSLGTIHLNAMVRLQNAAGLAQYAQTVSDPHSGVYRRFLTPAQIASQYGASASDYAAAEQYFASFGLQVGGWPQRIGISISGTQSAIEAAFGTKLAAYTTATGTVIGPASTPHFSASVPVVAVTNLVTAAGAMASTMVPPPAPSGTGNNFTLGYTPQQLAFAFDYDSAYQAGFTGKGISIGIIATDAADPADVAAYKKTFGWPGLGTFTQVAASAQAAVSAGRSPTAIPPPVTAPCSGVLPACNPEGVEAQIDTEQVLLAPDANTLFYLAYVPDECLTPSAPASPGAGCGSTNGTPNPDYGPQLGIHESGDEIEQAIADDQADVLSLSYGGPEQLDKAAFTNTSGAYDPTSFGATEFHALAAEGIAVFVSSGDSGAQGCAQFATGSYASYANLNCVSWPSISDDVTSVGGVTTPLDNAGRFIGPITGWGLQTNPRGRAASGGGVAQIVPQPIWQNGELGITGSTRNVPDVSLEGDEVTGVATIVNSEWGYARTGPYGGTSVAAPEMAAMWALVLQACQQTPSCATASGPHAYRLGNAAPLLYSLYAKGGTILPTYAQTFYDVQFGNNGVSPCLIQQNQQVGVCPSPQPTPEPGFTAGVGYDHVTGIGVPFARHLIKQVVGV